VRSSRGAVEEKGEKRVILGVGTDILNMQRLHDILEAESDSFVRKVFTAREREQAAESPDPVSYYATRFSGKEAVFKCFGIHGNVRLSEIEILDGETGQPYVTLSGQLNGIAADKGIRSVLISLSCENEYAVAFAVAQD
jgi:phosphopantetheine--protein transferase-like protein